MSAEDTRKILKEKEKEAAIIYTSQGFRFQCIIKSVGESVVLVHDTKKNYDKMIQLADIKEVDFP